MADEGLEYFGHVAFGAAEVISIAAPGNAASRLQVDCARGKWLPPSRLTGFLPSQFSLPLTCYTGSDGLRRYVPDCNFEVLIDLGAVGGLAVMHGVKGFDKAVDYSYRAMHLLHQRVRGRLYQGTWGMREHLSRNFDYSRDLFIRAPGRTDDSTRSVLPDHVGLTPEGSGRSWSVAALLAEGREAALDAGHASPTSRQAIPFGLYEAARRNPLVLATEEVSSLVRLALFDTDGHQVSDELLQQVQERLLAAIEPHLDDAAEDFCRWFSGSEGSLIKQIAKQKKPPGGKLRQELVRSALVQLGWESYRYVGPCVHAFMRTVKNALPGLTENERRLFEHMHESQPYFGDLPAAMLAERMPFLRRGVLAIWNEPQNQAHVAVLHRLLRYYAEMASSRRTADQQAKQHRQTDKRSQHKEAAGQTSDKQTDRGTPEAKTQTSWSAHHVTYKDDEHTPIVGVSRFHEVAEHLRELANIECPAHCLSWEYRLVLGGADEVKIEVRCECQQVSQVMSMSRERFEAEARRILVTKPGALRRYGRT